MLFYFTFGQKYRAEPHPAGGHPDGYFTVSAVDEHRARTAMVMLCDRAWAFCYTERPDPRIYPLGELRCIDT